MKFKIIPNEQTPEVKILAFDRVALEYDKQKLVKFLSFASRQFNCCGLAANQVSLDGERIMENFFAIKIGHIWDLVICPQILAYKGKPKIEFEGCLTWLGKTITAKRYPVIDVTCYNIKGKKFVRTISGFEAQIWQHECNHLNGIKENIVEK